MINPIKKSVEFEQEARERGVSVQELCRERGESDVYEINSLYNNLRGMKYHNPVPVPLD